MNKQRIYLDYNSTTPTDPRVVEAMLPYFYDRPGNAASRSHPFGWEADEAVDQARQHIANLIQADPQEVIFTSGATESDNLALRGIYQLYQRKGKHLITLATEHSAVLDTCQQLEKWGAEVTYLSVDEKGLIHLPELEAAIREDTILVSVMWANNETGVIQPMAAIGEICARHGLLLMSDATQAVGKIPVHPRECGIHLMAFTAHKMYGPKGVGALYVSRKNPRVKVAAQLTGGGHEQGMRSGTLNVPGIVGFGQAAAIAQQEMMAEAQRLQPLRDQLEQELSSSLELVYRNGTAATRLPQVSNLQFKHVDGEGLLATFKQEIAVSSGSACTSANPDASHVLRAMGLSEADAKSSLRFSLGRFTTREEIEYTIAKVRNGVEHLRSISPIWELYQDGRL